MSPEIQVRISFVFFSKSIFMFIFDLSFKIYI